MGARRRSSWTLERCKLSAKVYKTRSAWRIGAPSAYRAAKKYGWLQSCCAHMEYLKKPNGYWTEDKCLQDARQYLARSEWEKNSPSAYQRALKSGWLKKCSAHMKRPKVHNKKWTEKEILNSAAKYSARSQWAARELGAYIAARRLGILDEACAHMSNGHRRWSVSAIAEDAKRFQNRSSWRNASPGAYAAAKRRRLLGTVTRHMKPVPRRWSRQDILSEAKKFTILKEWRKKGSDSYSAALKLGIARVASRHMQRATRSWSKRELLAEGKKFKTRSEWQRKETSSYQIAARLGILDQACRHMRPIGHRYLRLLYAIENPDRSVYVGLSYDPEARYFQHVSSKSRQKCDLVLRKHFKRGNQKLKVFKKKYSVNHIKTEERRLIEHYRRTGWKILNTAKGGALGTPTKVHTLEACMEKVRFCKSRTEFANSFPSAYNAVLSNGWKEKVFKSLPSKVRRPYTRRELQEVALKYKTRAEFMKYSSKEYGVAGNRGLLPQITRHMGAGRTHRISDRKIEKFARQCKTIREFRTEYPRECSVARRRGSTFFQRITKHMKRLRLQKWTRELILESARSYRSTAEWKNKSPRSFKAAYRRGILSEVKKLLKLKSS